VLAVARTSLAAAICDEHGIVLVFDEVRTGFGRTGKMWAAEYYGVTPDILVFGKSVGGGFPLAGVLASTELAGFQPGDEALTFGEFPVSLAAGLPPCRFSTGTACCRHVPTWVTTPPPS
jgi:4-aminobutyrate aminotransferase-like enzyme